MMRLQLLCQNNDLRLKIAPIEVEMLSRQSLLESSPLLSRDTKHLSTEIQNRSAQVGISQ